MDEKIAIQIKGLSKCYPVTRKKIGITIGERIHELFAKRKNHNENDFYALKDVNLTIYKGESVGIIGRNGAGKSTLLKILAEVVEPSEGSIEINGTVASVLEIGMGFHPELTGRENVYLSGAMLGMPKNTIARRFDEIVEFAGIPDFIDTPVKHYSSGMYLRLAFSFVSHIEADTMLFDETISTGDLNFQMKCHGKIEELIQRGKTILLVSHNMNDIARLSKRIIYLENGIIKSDSHSNSLNNYLNDSMHSNKLFIKTKTNNEIGTIHSIDFKNTDYPLTHSEIELKRIQIVALGKGLNETIYTSDEIELSIEYAKKTEVGFFDIGFTFSYANSIVFYIHTLHSDINIEQVTAAGYYRVSVKIPPNFFNDSNIQIGISISKNNREIIFAYKNFLSISLKHTDAVINRIQNERLGLPRFIGPIFPQWEWEINKK